MMEKVFAFDVDGTLTKPRQLVNPGFNAFFREFCVNHPVYLVTGSDRKKLIEQLPLETVNLCLGAFTCSGAELWTGDDLTYRKEHEFPPALLQAAEHFIDTSPYDQRYGNHIEPRAGMLNISVVGRNADLIQRKAYSEWDKKHNERRSFVEALLKEFPDYEASTGGQISIDIVPNGWTKAVAKLEIETRHPGCAITFFGDKMGADGNDKPLADALASEKHHRAIEVRSYLETWEALKMMELRKAA